MGQGTSFGLPTSGSGNTTPGSYIGDTLKFETFHGGNILKKIGNDPSRLITGVDPASTTLWNGILGTHNKPIVDQLGGATGDDYAKASNAGINTTAGHDTQDVAHVIAAAMGASALAGAGGAGGAGAGAGGDAGMRGMGGDTALMGDGIDAGGGWSPAGDSALMGDNIDAGGGWNAGGYDPALEGDNIDAGGGWNPSSSSSSGSSLTNEQAKLIANALQSATNKRNTGTSGSSLGSQTLVGRGTGITPGGVWFNPQYQGGNLG